MSRKYSYIGLIIFFVLWITACSDDSNERNKEVSQQKEPLQLESQLKNIEECYLCGNSDKNMMSYYRQFNTIGLIALNEWYILDFRLEIEDSNSGTSMVTGRDQGISYSIDAVPNRGMSHMTVSTEKEFDSTIIQSRLCQMCLKRVEELVVKERPFIIVDFKTLEIYSVQNEAGYFIGDYWIEVEHNTSTKISAYHLPKKNQ